jgi:hypothetical protein
MQYELEGGLKKKLLCVKNGNLIGLGGATLLSKEKKKNQYRT